jgi:hypothetical protein
MTSYQTYLTIDDSQKIVLDNLPFAAGTKVEIKIHCVDEQRLEAARQLQGLFKELQALPSSLALTEEAIAEEVNVYRRFGGQE